MKHIFSSLSIRSRNASFPPLYKASEGRSTLAYKQNISSFTLVELLIVTLRRIKLPAFVRHFGMAQWKGTVGISKRKVPTKSEPRSFFISVSFSSSSSFTLVELLIVIGILAILTSAIVLILNPAELLRQSRDTTRMSDLASINNAISLALTQDPSLSLGTASTVYVSLIDTTSSCINLGLATLPSGYIYRCPTSATSATQINGSGWLPINFASSSISSLTKLPLDPTNTTSSGLYFYSYVTNGSQYELVSSFESKKYTDKEASDGGANTTSYEVGNNTTLAPFIGGLVGWWKFDETSGTTAYDSSGYGNHGTMVNNPVPIVGKILGGLNFYDTTSVGKYVSIPYVLSLDVFSKTKWTVIMWVKPTTGGITTYTVLNAVGHKPRLYADTTSAGSQAYVNSVFNYLASGSGMISDQWNFVVYLSDGDSDKIYINGREVGSGSYKQIDSLYTQIRIGASGWSSENFMGTIDDVRIYNRALSDAEIKALYNATK